MSEFTKSPETEYRRNIELLKHEDRLLAEAYNLAVKADSRLADVIICPEYLDYDIFSSINKNRAERPWETENGKAEVHILFGDNSKMLPSLEDVMKAKDDLTLESLLKSFIDMIGADDYNLVNISKLCKIHILLHELGHVSDFFDNIGNPDEYDEVIEQALWQYNAPIREKKRLFQEQEVERLAIITVADNISLEEYKKRADDVPKRLDALNDKYTKLLEDVAVPANEMARRYCAMPHEQFANNFAKEVLMSNPEFVESLIEL